MIRILAHFCKVISIWNGLILCLCLAIAAFCATSIASRVHRDTTPPIAAVTDVQSCSSTAMAFDVRPLTKRPISVRGVTVTVHSVRPTEARRHEAPAGFQQQVPEYRVELKSTAGGPTSCIGKRVDCNCASETPVEVKSDTQRIRVSFDRPCRPGRYTISANVLVSDGWYQQSLPVRIPKEWSFY